MEIHFEKSMKRELEKYMYICIFTGFFKVFILFLILKKNLVSDVVKKVTL